MAASIERARALRKRLTHHEVKLWVRLRALRSTCLHFRRQAPIGNYIVDFACLRQSLIVELDGGHHASPSQSQRDAVRDAFLVSKGFRLLRFWNSDVDRNIEGVVETILAELSPTPTGQWPVAPPPGGREQSPVT